MSHLKEWGIFTVKVVLALVAVNFIVGYLPKSIAGYIVPGSGQ